MSTLVDNRRARLTDYAPWMLRDYASNQGLATVIVVLLIGLVSLQQPGLQPPFATSGVPAEIATRVLHAVAQPLAFLGTFFATNGIVANDRKLGYYRFLFAKPVTPPSYYAVKFLAHGVGLLAVSLALLGVWAWAVRPMFPIELFIIVLVMYVAYGGIGFLLSAAWRFDWLSLVTVILVAHVGWLFWGDAQGLRHWVLYLLPPVHRTDDVYALMMTGIGGVNWVSVAWVGGYGLACFALGMLVIRKRPLGTS